MIQKKQQIIDKYPTIFEDEYMIQVENFAREMLLDPSECENTFFILPQLTRDSFSKKGLFYQTDKIIIENFSAHFSYPNAQKAKIELNEAFDVLQDIIEDP